MFGIPHFSFLPWPLAFFAFILLMTLSLRITNCMLFFLAYGNGPITCFTDRLGSNCPETGSIRSPLSFFKNSM
jgi:hypothetical protein